MSIKQHNFASSDLSINKINWYAKGIEYNNN